MSEEKKRCSDNWLYTMLPKVIEIVAVIAVIYGGVKVTLAALVNDVEALKCKIERQVDIDGAQNLKINTVENDIKFIRETLTRIDRKIK